MRRLIFILLMSFISLNSFATSQVSDRIIYKGDTLRLLTNPLESYFEAHNLNFRNLCSIGSRISSCWRGYVAYFEIKEGNLYVVDISVSEYYQDEKGKHQSKDFSVMDSVFPNQKEYLLKEYSGLLRIPIGKRTNYVHMGYASDYEGYNFIEVEQGKVLGEKFLSNEEYNLLKETQYKEYIKTQEFNESIEKEIKEFNKKKSKRERIDKEFMINFYYMLFEPKISTQDVILNNKGKE